MSRASCLAALRAEGIELDKFQLEGVADTIEATIQNAKRDGRSTYDAVQEAIDGYVDSLSELADVLKRNEALNFEARARIKDYILTYWSDAPAEGMRTLLTGVQANRVGAKDAVAVLQQQLADKYIGNLVSRMEVVGPDGRKPADYIKPSWWGGKNEHSTDVMRIMYHMNQATPDTAKYAGKPPSMIKAAQILLEVQETVRKDANAAGSHQIAKLDNRIIRRTHDMEKMLDVDMAEWKADMLKYMDKTKSDIKDEDLDGVLTRHYNQTITGERVANPDGNPEVSGIPGGMANVSKSMTHARVFHFKDVDSEIAYFKKYSKGDLLETVVFDLEVSAQRIGLMRRFGPNAKANFDRVAQEIGYDLSKGKDSQKYNKFQKRMGYINRTHWPMVDGSLFVPASHSIAKAAQWYRSVKLMALLGKAVVSSIVDIPIYATQVKYTGGGFFGGMAEAVGSLATNRRGGTDEILSGLGVIADNMRNTTLSRFDPDHIMAGGGSKMTEIFFKLNLLTPWTDRLRTGYALARSNELAGHAKKEFTELSPEWQRTLTQFNIQDAEWNVIKKGALKEFDDRKYITPESIKDINDSVIENYLTKKGLPVHKNNIIKYKTELSDRFRSFYNYTANTAALSPDAGTRAMMLQGTKGGSAEGEFARFVGMFKSFPTAYMRQVLGRDLRGHRSDIPESVVDLMTERGAMINMARTVASTTLFGFLAGYLKDLADGKKTPEITNENFHLVLLKAMMDGGALGHYGQFLIGEATSSFGNNPLTSFMGPAAQDIGTVADIYSKMMSTDPQIRDAGADALSAVLKNVPGSNLFYTKMAYDYLVIYQIMEMADPGSLRRMEQARDSRDAAPFFIPPSSVIP